MFLLAIESSCDETSASVVTKQNKILSNVVASSKDFFEKTGGIVPEIAARKQLEFILPIIDTALKEAGISLSKVDYISVTTGPGLVGSLFVGVTTAKTLSIYLKKPIIPINHLLGHLFSVFVKEYKRNIIQENLPQFPLLSLIVSGGHTDLVLVNSPYSIDYLGGTRDDAVGEAFDKVARLLNLSNYLGGPKISMEAKKFQRLDISSKLTFPRPLKNSNDYDFSFSGLKTAVLRYLQDNPDYNVSEVAFAFEEAIVDVLLYKLNKAYKKFKPKNVSIVGGVSANSKLRKRAKSIFKETLFIPPIFLCGDNAGMIGIASLYYLNKATFNLSGIKANPSESLRSY